MNNLSFNNWQQYIAKELSKDYKSFYYSAKYTKKKEVKKVLLSKISFILQNNKPSGW